MEILYELVTVIKEHKPYAIGKPRRRLTAMNYKSGDLPVIVREFIPNHE